MKDIPIFTGSTGSASLILREIPYQRTAYVLVRSVLPGGLRELLLDCGAFCAQAGAERVLVTASGPIGFLPHVHDMLELACHKAALPPLEDPVALEPLTAEHGEAFCELYNERFRAIPNAETCRREALPRLVSEQSAFFALVDGVRAGLGVLGPGELRAVAVLPQFHGLGSRLTRTLLERLEGPTLTLRVSSANSPALRLYARLGFQRQRVLSRWYLLRGARAYT